MGKTALLLELADRAKEFGFISVRVTASERMLDEIIEGIQLAGLRLREKKGKAVKSVSAGAYGFSFGLTFTDDIQNNYGFRTKLTLLCEALAKRGKGILLLVDEIRTNTPEMRELATTYQHLVGDGTNIAFAMAGLPNAISNVLNDDILTFLNRAQKVRLGALPLNDISVYFMDVFRGIGAAADPKVLDSAVVATKGYPYLLQLIGYNIIKQLGNTDTITSSIAELAVINSKRALEQDIFIPCLRTLSNEDKRFLEAMAKDPVVSRVADLKERLNVTGSHIQTYKERLIEAGVVDSPGRGLLEFSVPYLGAYLRGEV
ncbi:MAG: ATP-binding protein [Clostridiales Family XIII bacterium]|nr:ATP-binding protein [Clostridiales Family XIII bacterium]